MSHPLIDEVKARTGLKSDYAIAKAIGASRELISRWTTGKSNPDGLNTLKLINLGNIEPSEALKIMTRQDEKTQRNGKSQGENCILCKIKRVLPILVIPKSLKSFGVNFA